MKFKFRAQAALDMRLRELQDAQRELAAKQGDRDAAQRRFLDAEQALHEARVSAGAAQTTVTDCTTLQWYRFWIVRLDHEKKAHAATLAKREEAVARATAACVRAKQRCESLERFRDRARAQYDEALAADERKLIDELATRRYASTRQSALAQES